MISTAVLTTIAPASAGIAIGVSLIIFLVTQELAGDSERLSLRLLSSYLRAFSIPLLIVFTFITTIELFEIVS